MSLDRFYPIFDHPDWLPRMLPLGVKLVQMRIKDRPAADLRAMLSDARDACREAGAVMVVNDHWELAIDLGCDWLHLGQEDLDTADLCPSLSARLPMHPITSHWGRSGRPSSSR